MLLRLMLVSFVTSMGLELPSSHDVNRWSDSGKAWVHAQMCDSPAPAAEVIPTVEPVAAGLSAEADLAFATASGAMVSDFAADPVLVASDDLPAGEDCCDLAPVDTVELVVVALPAGEEVEVVIEIAATTEPDFMVSDELATAEEQDDAPSRSERLAEAIRLSREAAHAWAAVIQEPVEEVGCSR